MGRKKRFLLGFGCILALVILLTACSSSSEQSTANSEQDYAANKTESVADSKEATVESSDALGFSKSIVTTTAATIDREEIERKIIKNANLSQKVTELEPALQKLEDLIDQAKGYIQSSAVIEYNENEREASYVIRVPQENYFSILDQIQGIGKNIGVTQRGEDVTQEFYDNEARIKNLRLQEEAVQRLFDQAKEMEDILRIQQELFRIRGEIETLQGRNRYLDNMSSLSTIEVTIREVKPVEYVKDATDSPWSRAKEGFIDSLVGVYNFFVNLLVYIISSLPVLVFIFLPAGLLLFWLAKQRQKRLRAKDSSLDHLVKKNDAKSENTLKDKKE